MIEIVDCMAKPVSTYAINLYIDDFGEFGEAVKIDSVVQWLTDKQTDKLQRDNCSAIGSGFEQCLSSGGQPAFCVR